MFNRQKIALSTRTIHCSKYHQKLHELAFKLIPHSTQPQGTRPYIVSFHSHTLKFSSMRIFLNEELIDSINDIFFRVQLKLYMYGTEHLNSLNQILTPNRDEK